MKKMLMNYYAVMMMVLFIIYNLVLKNLKIGGLLYQIFMIILIVANIILLIKFKKNIYFKGLIIILYFLIWLFSKNSLQCAFCLSSMIVLMITGFMESNIIKVITIFITAFFIIFSMPILFIYLLSFGTNLNDEKGRNDIYPDKHYYCTNDYEVYAYSAGAMDGFHYSIGKYYDFINIDDIIYVSYNERNEVSKDEYENYLVNHECYLMGDINEYR